MHNLVAVSVFECSADLASEFDHLLKIVGRRLAQVGTIHQLHDKEREAVIFTNVIDGHNVRMIQRRGGARLTQEARAHVSGGTSCRRTTTFRASTIFTGTTNFADTIGFPLEKNFDSDRAQ